MRRFGAVADQIDAAMEGMEAPAPEPRVHTPVPEPPTAKLNARHASLLPIRKLNGELLSIPCVPFHTNDKPEMDGRAHAGGFILTDISQN
jgi:hypothetical protein